MPYFLAIGVAHEEFMHSTPNMLSAYTKAHRLKQKMKDEEMWLHNKYTLEALSVALAHFGAGLSGKTSQAKYPEEPFMKDAGKSKAELSEEEKQKAVDLFFAREKARRVNWRRNHQR